MRRAYCKWDSADHFSWFNVEWPLFHMGSYLFAWWKFIFIHDFAMNKRQPGINSPNGPKQMEVIKQPDSKDLQTWLQSYTFTLSHPLQTQTLCWKPWNKNSQSAKIATNFFLFTTVKMMVLIMKIAISHLHIYGERLSCQLCTWNNQFYTKLLNKLTTLFISVKSKC